MWRVRVGGTGTRGMWGPWAQEGTGGIGGRGGLRLLYPPGGGGRLGSRGAGREGRSSWESYFRVGIGRKSPVIGCQINYPKE